MKETKEEKLLRLWKTRQIQDGKDVSAVNTLEEAEHFYDKPKAEPKAKTAPKKKVAKK